MKQIQVFMLVMFSLFLCSCNENGKAIQPMSETINGPLGDCFKVVQDNYLINEGQVTIELKRIKNGWPVPMKTNAVMGDCDECYEPSFMAEFMDQKGNVLEKSLADLISAPEQMKALAELKLNETGTLVFAIESKGISKVRLLSDFVYYGTAIFNMRGTVNGTMDILMSFELSPQGEAKGAYYHQKFGPKAALSLFGVLDGQDLTLNEYSNEGKHIGNYKGVFKDGTYTGSYAIDGRMYNFSLTEDPAMYPVDYSGINFNALSDEQAYTMSTSDNYEEFYHEMFESQGILLSAKDTMLLVTNKAQLELSVGDCDTLALTSLHETMPIIWSSSDETVAMVGSTGVVRAIGEGEAFIMASVQPTKRDTVTTKVYVKVNAPAKKKTSSSGKPQSKASSIDLGYATYEPLPQDGLSGVKNGQPHGNGIMRFKSSHTIPGTQDCVAEAGEWVNGMWRDGKINVGTWYRNDGNQVIVKLGQRYNR